MLKKPNSFDDTNSFNAKADHFAKESSRGDQSIEFGSLNKCDPLDNSDDLLNANDSFVDSELADVFDRYSTSVRCRLNYQTRKFDRQFPQTWHVEGSMRDCPIQKKRSYRKASGQRRRLKQQSLRQFLSVLTFNETAKVKLKKLQFTIVNRMQCTSIAMRVPNHLQTVRFLKFPSHFR